jgi:hypothetical protein
MQYLKAYQLGFTMTLFVNNTLTVHFKRYFAFTFSSKRGFCNDAFCKR